MGRFIDGHMIHLAARRDMPRINQVGVCEAFSSPNLHKNFEETLKMRSKMCSVQPGLST